MSIEKQNEISTYQIKKSKDLSVTFSVQSDKL